jgi:predicted phage terminase large subunit-like protein
VGYCIDVAGNKLADELIRFIVLEGDMEAACLCVSQFLTKREIEMVHRRIIRNICSAKNTVDLAPRGFGKSTVGDVDYCITRILRDGNIRIMIGSKTQTQADAFLKEVRAHFEQNEDIIRIFGNLKGVVWNDSEFSVSTRTVIKKEATLTALGASGAVVSKHFDIIMGDDLVGFENARTKPQRDKLFEWFYSSLYPTLEPEGEIHILGTRYHPMDLYQGMIDSGVYKCQVQRAIEKNGKSLWEKKFPLTLLLQKKAESGSIIFAMQYQNDVELAKGKIFKGIYFRYYDSWEISDGDVYVKKYRDDGRLERIAVRVFMGCDLAIREKEQSDYFVCFVVGISEAGDYFVLKYIKDRLTFKAQTEAIKNMYTEFPMAIRVGIETVSYQFALYQVLEESSTLPLLEINTSKDKVTRAMKRSALFENGKVHFLAGKCDDLEECLLLFPDVEHDDLFDGMDFAITASEQSHISILDFYEQEMQRMQMAEIAKKAEENRQKGGNVNG